MLLVELLFLFVCCPLILITSLPIVLKIIIALGGVAYAIRILYKDELIDLKAFHPNNFNEVAFSIAIRFVVIIIATLLFMWIFQKDKLFFVVLKNPMLWIGIVCFYSIFSVYPQEVIYRTFFIHRYQKLFKSHSWLIFVNALLFSFAHIIFNNAFVLLVTFIGGIFFTLTYLKTKNLTITSIEHAIYGSWLFTIGMGEMLAFPTG